jgi:hypothetical protein
MSTIADLQVSLAREQARDRLAGLRGQLERLRGQQDAMRSRLGPRDTWPAHVDRKYVSLLQAERQVQARLDEEVATQAVIRDFGLPLVLDVPDGHGDRAAGKPSWFLGDWPPPRTSAAARRPGRAYRGRPRPAAAAPRRPGPVVGTTHIPTSLVWQAAQALQARADGVRAVAAQLHAQRTR